MDNLSGLIIEGSLEAETIIDLATQYNNKWILGIINNDDNLKGENILLMENILAYTDRFAKSIKDIVNDVISLSMGTAESLEVVFQDLAEIYSAKK